MASLKRQRIGRLAFEAAASARPQLPSAAPATTRQILDREAARPLRGGNNELGYSSLFGGSHLQKELF